ncbi:hypothetical protein T01_11065 [Trichinella spiralis]|uniref:Uncharacterized protein n=1 Tax=Trichinella spiralis TaxID=6334 RepID=A0A0V1B8F0_TRISP|nr:hypothetical protein T01_11065 [Trichinella spiralis]
MEQCSADLHLSLLLFKIPLCNDLPHYILFFRKLCNALQLKWWYLSSQFCLRFLFAHHIFLFFFSESSRLIFSAALELLSLDELAFLSIPHNKVVDQCQNNYYENRGE